VTPVADFKQVSTSSLVQLFAEDAAANGRALENAKPRLANKNFDAKTKLYTELRSRGVEAQRALLSLLEHADPHVRCSTAVYALEFASHEAEPILEALKELRGAVGFTARITLDQWKKGELRFS
jgi:hypothetical protein